MNDLINRLLLAAENRPDIRPLLQEAANEIASLKSRIEIRASLPEAPAVPVVKALKWTDHPAGGKQALAAGLGLYRVHANGDDWYLVPDHMGKGGKAAAQADFEARIRAVLATPPAPTAAVDGEVVKALVNLAHEMRFLLRHNPDKDGGLYRLRLDEADAAIALANGECPHKCDEGGMCLAEHSGFPQSCPRAALSKAHLSPGTAEEEKP